MYTTSQPILARNLEMGDSSNGERNKSLEMADSGARIEDLKYLYASNVNVSNFVSEKLSGHRKYHVWKAQMVCLMETQKMHGIVDPKFVGPEAQDADIVKQYDNLLRVPAAMFYPIYQLICLFILVLLYPFIVLYFLLWKVLATVVAPIKLVEKKKKDYKEAKEILKLVCDHIDRLGFSGSHHPCYSRPILEAACQGAYEVVDEILFRFPKAIDCKNQNGLNIIQLAVINRSEKVYNLIYHIVERKDFYRTVMDSSKNNILHLAGRLSPSPYITEENIFKETPEMVFTREHEKLVKEGEKWMKSTAESCSITAALITTIVFAAAITVPGGSNQETGIPMFKGTIPFTIFAVSDAISLFASTTALLVFLSILTARFSEQDFLVSLPRRLIIGLCTLFLSTTMMMIAFSATLFLVFVDQRNWMLAPIGGLTCLPIAVFVTLQFPLVVDLFRSTYFPIFGKQSYIERGKFNPNNIQYFFGNRGIEYVLE
ncbi:hypothetical protein Ccrd_025264 [Cynara cardunculus var. scolymus]|uniref:PGG domain-containing protein n=2 Tax=Cynara cardunculus var. scolymus TaxID=59895 RepID=A0A103XB61_CYNCS|nr:hypothetical protein Ccrd_025264 [Cynara cardunculus var. scolymus]